MPEVARALSEPLSRVDKITVVSTGEDGAGTGVNKVTADIGTMIAQVPALVEGLTGVNIGQLLRQLPQIGGAIAAADGHRSAAANGAQASAVAGEPAANDRPHGEREG